MQYFMIMLIIMFAGFVQGASGFGFGLVALGLISLFADIKDTSVMLAIAGFGINLVVLWRLWRYFRKERMMPVIVSAAIGAPFGVLFLLGANETAIKQILGVILLAALIQRLVPHLKGKRWSPWWLGIPAGFLGGALSGAFGTGGPPVVAYTASQNFEKHRYVACVQVALGVGSISRIISLSLSGAFTGKIICMSSFCVFFAVVGACFGLALLKKIPDHFLRIMINILLLLLTVKYCFF